MSVVNRMLQDIDQRLGSAGVEPLGAPAGIRSIPAAAAPASPHGRTARIVLLSLCVVAVAALASRDWRELWPSPPPGPTSATSMSGAQTVTAPASPAVPTPARVTPIEAAPPEPAPAPAPVAAAAPPTPVLAPAGKKAAPEPVAAPSSPEILKLSMQLTVPVSDTPRPRGAKAETVQRSAAPVRQVAADETVQAARALWNEGAQAASTATLRDALAAAESSRDPAATAMIARELARLEMLANRPQAAVDLLRRLEPVLDGDADAWALRGNAEQRLALHAQAAASYLVALRLKPTEGKWMLGAAISLAAGGDLDAAQAWVDRAGDRGAITPPIATYLQQLGIATTR